MPATRALDGTELVYERHGDDPSALLLHGTAASRDVWAGFSADLDGVGVLAADRRNHGDSGGGDPALDRQRADVEALAREVDGPLALVGHSFGGLLALSAAPVVKPERLVLYEPAVLARGFRERSDLADRMAGRVERGERRGAAELYFEEAAGIEPPTPVLDAAAANAETLVAENRIVEQFAPEHATASVPTLLLTGERGPDHLHAGARALAASERVEHIELDGVGHAGVSTAPERVAEKVRSFLPTTK